MRNKSLLSATAAMLIALSGVAATPVHAQHVADPAPLPQLAYQGRLVEGATPVTASRVFDFSILDAQGNALWTSGDQTLQVGNGLYSVVLGGAGMPTLPATLLGHSGLKLHVSVAGTALAPDVDILPAFQARSAWEVLGSFGGDIGGTQNETLVMKLQGIPLDFTTSQPVAGQSLVFDGSKFVASSVAGTPGATGAQGPKGNDGAAGTAGKNGIDGKNGTNGLNGKDGANGLNGVNGVDGAVGKDGKDGLAGTNGKSVLNGLLDPTVDLGTDGDFFLNTVTNVLYGPRASGIWPVNGVSLVGTKGDAGVAGKDGKDGKDGTNGLNGTNGTQGIQGIQGVAGKDGKDGINGINGSNGAQGLQGVAGKDGLNGLNGIDGGAGKDGVNGLAGTNGKTILNGLLAPTVDLGTDGDFYLNTVTSVLYGPKASGIWPVSGVSLVGLKGDTGAAGTNGIDGKDGLNGTNGAQGIQGVPGVNGINGSNGSDGAQGPKGDSGAQGIQGLQGVAGPKGDTGAQGPAGGSAATMTPIQIARKQWTTSLPVNGAYAVAFDGQNIWVGSSSTGKVTKITNGAIVGSWSVASMGVSGLAFDGTRLWATEWATNKVYPVALDGTVGTAVLAGSAASAGMVFDGSYLWVANGTLIYKIDPVGLTVVGNIDVTAQAGGVAFDGTRLWISLTNGYLMVVDPSLGDVSIGSTVNVIPATSAMAYDESGLWVLGVDGNVHLLNVEDGSELASIVAPRLTALASDGGSVWGVGFANVVKINPGGLSTVYTSVSGTVGYFSAAFDGQRMWVADGNGSKIRAFR